MHKLEDRVLEYYKKDLFAVDRRLAIASEVFAGKIEHREDKDVLWQKFHAMWDECLTSWVFPDEEDSDALL